MEIIMSENKKILKSCPKCGSDDITTWPPDECSVAEVVCDNCGYSERLSTWNKRPEVDRLKLRIDAENAVACELEAFSKHLRAQLTAAREEIERLKSTVEILNNPMVISIDECQGHPTCETCGNEEICKRELDNCMQVGTIVDWLTYCSAHTALNTDEKEG
jgi:predicted nucleic-acid-binding Zn-ribbon protein